MAQALRRSRGRATIAQLVQEMNRQIGESLQFEQTVQPYIPGPNKDKVPFPGDGAGMARFDRKRPRRRAAAKA